MRKNLRRILFTAGLLAIVIAICVVCFIVGRGHTVYLDNKTIDDTNYEAYYLIEVNYKGEDVCELYKKERGIITTTGQKLTLELSCQEGKMSDKETVTVTIELPYDMDDIVINLAAYLEGADYDTYLTKFVSLKEQPETEEEVDTSDEFGLTSEG